MLDWLVGSIKTEAGVYRGASDQEIVLDNGLLRRTFRLQPNGATVGLDNLMTGVSVLRAVKPEARVTINGKVYAIGGLQGQPEKGYLLPEWIPSLKSDPTAFHLVHFEVGKPAAHLAWKRKRHAGESAWPPRGVALRMDYEAPAKTLAGLRVSVHYELYAGSPLLCKWLTLQNGSSTTVTIDQMTVEELATVEVDSAVDVRDPKEWKLPALTLLSDYSFRGMDATTANRTTEWLADPEYNTQVNFELKTPAVVVSRPPIGPDVPLAAGESFNSFRSYLLLHDSDNRERQGMAIRRLHRTVSPWATENPIMMHVRNADTITFRNAVDQCAEVGFEMIIYTFGSGFNMEDERPEYLAQVKADIDYAHAKGIEVGAYSLLASRGVSQAVDVINPATGRTGGAIFGTSPCLATDWGKDYFRKMRHFIDITGLDLLEHDGSYPGDVCASTHHSGHRDLNDSQWQQWKMISDFYSWCRERGVYLNVPDYYFLAGSSKTGMGYRESNWSLPRERQLIHGRQNIFDGTWTKTPSMGWMFVPLVEYQGGGAAATLEPLHDHLDAYAAHLINNLSAGVQACYRGPRLYDTPETRAVVQRWVAWFKQHRAILESDVIHLRRADGRDIDGLLHVNPQLKERGLAVIFNPLPTEVERNLELPLYYTGLTEIASIRQGDAETKQYKLTRDYHVTVPVKIAAQGFAWLVIE